MQGTYSSLHDLVYATILTADTSSNTSSSSSSNATSPNGVNVIEGLSENVSALNISLPGSSVSSSIISNDTVLNNTNFGNATAASPSSQVNFTSSASPYAGTLQIPYTGLTRYHATPEVAKLFGLNETIYAIIVTEVEPRSPAANAGIRGGNMTTSVAGDIIKVGGDIILRMDGNDTFVRNNDAFLHYIQNEKRVGENMTLTVLRDGIIEDVQLTIGSLPRFVWYENRDEGIKIKYPSDWEVSESESIEDIVKFFSPETVSDNNGTAPVAGTFVVTVPAGERGLDDLASSEQRETTERRHLDIILTSVSGLPGYETVFYDYSDANRTLKQLSAFTIKDGQIYRINFATDPSRYDDYLPLAREIIKSFQFTK